jgi:hypothetical protein
LLALQALAKPFNTVYADSRTVLIVETTISDALATS